MEDILQIDYYEQEIMSCGGLAYSVRCLMTLMKTWVGKGRAMLHLKGRSLGTKNVQPKDALSFGSVLVNLENGTFADGVRDLLEGGQQMGRKHSEMNCLGMLVD